MRLKVLALISYFVFACLAISKCAMAQDVLLHTNLSNPIQLNANFSLVTSANNNKYIATKWAQGKLFYANGSSKIYDSLNFDRHLNIMEVVVNNKVVSLLPMGLSGALIYSSQSSGYLLIAGKVLEKNRFLQVICEGQYVLASYLTTSKIEVANNYKIDEVRFAPKNKNDLIIRKNFVLLRNGKWEDFKITKSTIGKLFKVDKKELQVMINKNNLQPNSKQNLVQLFKWLNDN